MHNNVPIITLALTLRYFASNSYTTGRALSCSSATDSKISKLGYSCLNEDSRFWKRLVSKPFKGRRMDTPGAEDNRVVATCRFLYLLRLSTARSKLLKRNSRQQLTHAVQQPNSPTDQIITYQINPTIARQTLKMWCQSCVVLTSRIGLIMSKLVDAFKDTWSHFRVFALTTLPPGYSPISSQRELSEAQATRDEIRIREPCIGIGTTISPPLCRHLGRFGGTLVKNVCAVQRRSTVANPGGPS